MEDSCKKEYIISTQSGQAIFMACLFYGNYRKNSASFTIKILHYPKIQVFSCKACKKYGVFRRKIKW
ncbi:hypothetical protein DXC97_15485 [Lachnospiraceae bacterium TF09-5]|nr:hypothetical protein DXC97_15485 [Lachnospiraceae bacterium TF09-5]